VQETERSRLENLEQSLAEVTTYLKTCEATTNSARQQRLAHQQELEQARADFTLKENEATSLKFKHRQLK
jgi:hypothetical protein